MTPSSFNFKFRKVTVSKIARKTELQSGGALNLKSNLKHVGNAPACMLLMQARCAPVVDAGGMCSCN